MVSRVLNFGSLNIDHLYRVPHFVRPGGLITGGADRGSRGVDPKNLRTLTTGFSIRATIATIA